ncbi:MAG: TraR/DksA C4-type zinc finger protein [Pseudomonadota bacterium]
MRDDLDIATVKDRLATALAALDAEDAAGRDEQATVTLDQQSVGRLSRMDAMQRQAMAQATARRRVAERARIRSAIARLDEGEYGYCTDCGEDIDPARLEANPAVALCLTCARG